MPRGAILAACLLSVAIGVGCNRNPFLGAQSPFATVPQGAPGQPKRQSLFGGVANSEQLGRLDELSRQTTRLDADNADLHRQLAQSKQQVQVLNEQLALMQKQLGDTARHARDLESAKTTAEQQRDGALASTRQPGGATIRANSSLSKKLKAIEMPGVEVRLEEDVVRIELPADRVFHPGTANLLATGNQLITQVADAVSKHYPRQRVVIEGHTSLEASGSTFAAGGHRVTAAQSMAVLEQMTSAGRLPARQLSAMALGDNHPRASNGTPAGRAKNRRIEVVIYPEAIE